LQKDVQRGSAPGAAAGGTPTGAVRTCHGSHRALEEVPHGSRAAGPGRRDASTAGNRALTALELRARSDEWGYSTQ